MATIGAYFRTDVAAFVTRYDGQQEIGAQVIAEELQLPTQNSQTSDLWACSSSSEDKHEPTGVKQAVEASKSREQEERLANLANELAKATRPINELDLPLRPEAAKTAQLRELEREKAVTLCAGDGQTRANGEHGPRSPFARRGARPQCLAGERNRDGASRNRNRRGVAEQGSRKCDAVQTNRGEDDVGTTAGARAREALASELAKVRQEVEAAAAVSSQKDDEAEQQKQTSEAAIQVKAASAEPQRRALDEAQARAAALASELAGTRREIETQAAQSQKAVDEAVQQKQAAEAAIAELQQTLQQEQKKTAALMQEAKAAQAR